MVRRLAGLEKSTQKFDPALAVIGVLTRDLCNRVANFVPYMVDLLAGKALKQL